MFQVRHTPRDAGESYNICDSYETHPEAVAAMIEYHVRFEQMDPAGSLDLTLTFVDGEPLLVIPGFGFYYVAEVI